MIDIETERTYFDINNGRLKIQKVFIGIVYNESVNNTDYSNLLQSYKFPKQPPKWKLAWTRRISGNSGGCTSTGSVVSYVEFIAMVLESENFDSSTMHDHLSKLCILTQDENTDELLMFADMLIDKVTD